MCWLACLRHLGAAAKHTDNTITKFPLVSSRQNTIKMLPGYATTTIFILQHFQCKRRYVNNDGEKQYTLKVSLTSYTSGTAFNIWTAAVFFCTVTRIASISTLILKLVKLLS